MMIRYDDLCAVMSPQLSIISPSLNHAQFLRWAIDSVASQSYRNFEHIVIDGGSTDGTLDILKTYPHIKWISEPDEHLTEAYLKGFMMSKGDYIIQCNVSDGFIDPHWFQTCVETLDADPDVSCVWACAQYLSEDGALSKITWPEFFDAPPPQKEGFFPLWLGTGFLMPEGNFCVRRRVYDECFPRWHAHGPFRENCFLGFNYAFHTRGYLARFCPRVVNVGRTHAGQRSERLAACEQPIADRYFQEVGAYRRKLLQGAVAHVFRDGAGQVIGEVTPAMRRAIRCATWRHRIARSRLVRTDLYSLQRKLRRKIDSHRQPRGNLSSEHGEREGGTQQALPVGGATRAPVIATALQQTNGGVIRRAARAFARRTIGLAPNDRTREAWLARVLRELPAGARILDAGAGELKYKPLCSHLRYVSQDFGEYDGQGDGAALQPGAWDVSHIDIRCDITAIPEPDASFDAVMCIEVLEHLPAPVDALRELARLLKPGGTLIVTSPFASLTHFSPYHFYSGFNRYFYRRWLEDFGLEILEITPNGNFFDFVRQELLRSRGMARDFAARSRAFGWCESVALWVVLRALKRLSAADAGSAAVLCFGYHVRARKAGGV